MKYDLKTVDSYIIGTVFEGRIINERTGKGEPVLLEEERNYSVFEFYNVPYNYSLN